MADANIAKLSSMHFYAWKKGLKTGMYYLRSRPASDPIKFTLDVEALVKDKSENNIAMEATMFNKVNRKTKKVKRKVKVRRKRPFNKKSDENQNENVNE